MKAAVLFCHTDEQEPNAAVERELGRQYTQLSQYANAYGFELEQVFFHVGQLDYEHPDDVLLRFLRGLQNSRSNIVIAETRDSDTCVLFEGTYSTNEDRQQTAPIACRKENFIRKTISIQQREKPLKFDES